MDRAGHDTDPVQIAGKRLHLRRLIEATHGRIEILIG
jgi:hypothetical protein